MVCQAAGQTKFKALKHENGIAGKTTIIVKVIACFQPLQNCQVCSFGLIAKELSQMSHQLLKSPDLDQMAYAQLDQNYNLPYFNSSTLTTDVAFQRQINSDLRVGEFLKLPRPYGNIPYPTENPYLKNSRISLPHSGLRVLDDKPIDASCASQEKKFLIFDRSGNHTRLLFSPSFPLQNQTTASNAEKMASRMDEQQFLSNSLIEEKWDENDLNDGEGEMLEDSEEIDALLYSDSDDEYDDEENDEVTSTMHVPFGIEEGSPKRQRLVDGGYNKSSLLSFESPADRAGSCNYNGIDSSERDKKVKIRETLKILESIIPGSKSKKDPVSVIEKAIVYLESMRIEAKALELTGPESNSATSP